MTRTEIKFAVNLPRVVTLDRMDAREYESKFENSESRWQYVVNDNRNIIYLPTSARNQLLKTGAESGDVVEITKLERGWTFKVLPDSAEPASEPEPGPRLLAPRPANGNGNGYTNGYTNGALAVSAPEAQPQPLSYPVSHPFEERYARMFVTAAHALQLAHAQLTREGFELEPFNWEDIRATAIHFGISFERREERAK